MRIRAVLVFLLLISVCTFSSAQSNSEPTGSTSLGATRLATATKPAEEKFRVYLGTYTDKESSGIYQCVLDLKDGSLTEPKLAASAVDPSFLAFHPNQKFLYAVNESKESISSFAIDQSSGKLKFLNSKSTKGGAPCHLIVDPSGRNVLAANYVGGSCICISLDKDGRLTDRNSFQQHVGPRKHGHSIHVDFANRFALCCDLGLDKVMIYKFDPQAGQLKPHGRFVTPKGAGPRHFAWHPDGKTAYINGETDLTVIVCDYDPTLGTLRQKQVLSTLPADIQRNGGSTAETVVHPSGNFVYVSNRDPYNSIAIFKVDPETHQLTSVGHESRGIKTPRNFAIDPTGKFMLVANQSKGDVIVFRIDQETGKLVPTESSVNVSRPVCVRFMKIK